MQRKSNRSAPRRCATTLLAALALSLPSCNNNPTPPAGAPPAADLSIPPNLTILASTSEPFLLSGAAIHADTATPLFRARLSPRSGQSLTAPALPAGATLRLRAAPAPLPARGEETVWITPAPEPGSAELPKGAATAEYLHTGAQTILRISRNDTGKLTITAEPAPGAK